MITDTEYLLGELEKGPRDAMQVISASLRDRGVGLTVHSRVADLRAQGYTITCHVEGETRKGRPRYLYTLISEPEAVAPPATPAPEPVVVEPLTQLELA